MKTPLLNLTEQVFKLHSVEQLKAAGYKKYDPALRRHAKCFYQKKLRAGHYLNIWIYDAPPGHPRQDEPQFEPESQLRSSSKTINSSLLHHNESLEQIEEHFRVLAAWFETTYGELED